MAKMLKKTENVNNENHLNVHNTLNLDNSVEKYADCCGILNVSGLQVGA